MILTGWLSANPPRAFSAVEQHVMSTGYIPKVQGRSWSALKAAAPSVHNLRRVDYWLGKAAEATSIPGGSWGLWALGKALQALIDFALGAVGVVLFAGATMIDMLVMLIQKAWTLQAEISSRIISLLSSVLKWCGRKVLVPGISITAAFLRYVLELLMRPLISMAQRAFDLIDGPL